MKQITIWIGALLTGAVLGLLQIHAVDVAADFVATVYTRLFRLLAVPMIVLAVITTMTRMGTGRQTGKVFRHALGYTLLTTVCAAVTGAVLFWLVSPGNLPEEIVASETMQDPQSTTYYDHILNTIPDNLIKPFLEGNVLALLIMSFAIGIGLSKLPDSENKQIVIKGLNGLQDLLFLLIRGLIWTLPLGVVAFAAQLTAQVGAGIMVDSIGKYVLVVLGGNAIQFLIVLPLFLLARRLNPVQVFTKMSPAVLMALFTKSSAATLPVTMESAEHRLGVRKDVARFVLPICTTINMNGCASFILVTSLFVMQNGGVSLTVSTVLLWILISVIAAVGNAGVPMGCFFLTFSLMSGIGAPVEILGLILPIYTVIDMIETAENVWSDSCVCAMTDHDLS